MISEWLRIRTDERGGSVSFKRFHPVEALTKTHADEFESGYDGDAGSGEDATGRLGRFIDSLGVELGAPVDRGYPHMLLGRAH